MEANWSHLLNLLILLLSPGAIAAGVADTLGKGGNITGDETLVSANGTFTMGFFSLGPSANKRYYLGIWFSVSRDAVCWVANRERPLLDKAGALVLSDTGSLLLRDSSGQVAWSSNSTVASSSSVEAQLIETGNLVVRDQDSGNVLLWQSFDHPSNTLLSGMKVGKNLWTGAEWHLTSWISADDPSPGPYRRVLDTSCLPDFVLWNGNATIYRSGPWNGRSFSGATEVLGNTYTDLQITLSVTTSSGEISYGYTCKPGAALTRLVVTDDGKVNRVVWDKSSQGWTQPIFQGPRDPCDDYGKCGSFGLCDVSSVLSFCGCLRGFSSASSSAWDRDTSGCRRNVELQCSSNGGTTDGFVVVKGVKLPDTHNATVDMGITMKECRSRCRANCSCLAYAAADIRGGGVPSGCVMWMDNIVDLRYVDQGQDLYLRLAKSELDKDFNLAAVVASVAFVAALALFLLIWWRTKTKRNASDGPRSPTMGDLSFDLPTVKKATEDFSQSHVIGEGGFAVVYKGELPDGTTVAVKRLKQSALTDKGKRDFAREVDVMANVRHGNLLRLLAYCNEGGERILIYAFMPNKSLDLYIFGEASDRARLNWRQRLDIIHGVAHGVAYLHQGSEESVVHRDLKPSNVLLDDNWKPKIADFNTAKLFIKDQPDQSDLTIVVSPGYASPEYLQGEMTLKCDVYSFGVILLETLSGRRNGPTKGVISSARNFWQQDRAMALLDPTVVPLPLSPPDSEMSSELERYIKIGLLCVQEASENRPDMSAVVAMLTTRNSDINLLPRAAQQNVASRMYTR